VGFILGVSMFKNERCQGKYSSPLGFHIESGSKTHPYEQSFLGIVSGFSLTKVNIPEFFGRIRNII
jgi:hypothetical protein